MGLNDLDALIVRKDSDGFLDHINLTYDGQLAFHSGTSRF